MRACRPSSGTNLFNGFMVDSLVKIWGEVVGAVLWDPTHGYAIFEYEPSFLTKGWDLSPIHMRLIMAQRGEREFFFPNIDPHTFNGLPGLLASALPDDFGNTIVDSWLVRNGNPHTPSTQLKGYVM